MDCNSTVYHVNCHLLFGIVYTVSVFSRQIAGFFTIRPLQNALIYYVLFLRRGHSTEQTPFIRLFLSRAQLSVESTEAIQIVSCSRTQQISTAEDLNHQPL